MRVMVKNDCPQCKLKIVDVFMLFNGWEYFLEEENKDRVAFGLVCGFEDELGSVYVPEVEPHIVSKAQADVSDALPAPGWHWADEVANI